MKTVYSPSLSTRERDETDPVSGDDLDVDKKTKRREEEKKSKRAEKQKEQKSRKAEKQKSKKVK